MSKYIDERPFEEVVQATILDGKHKDYIDTIVEMILRDEESGWRSNPFKGEHTLYDHEVVRLANQKAKYESELEQVQKHYESVFNKIVALAPPGEEDEEEDYDKEDEDYEEAEVYQEKGKGKVNTVHLKPAEVAKKKKQDAIARQNFQSTLATIQEQLRDLMTNIHEIESQLERYRYFQDVSIKCLRSLRRITHTYKQTHDLEFVKKGAYFVNNYSMMLMEQFDRSRV